jgi:hypothetical protein
MKALALVALLVPVALWADEDAGFMVERDNVEIAPAAGVRIRTIAIDNRLGDIQVIGRDQPGISLAVVKRAPDEDTLDRLKVNLVPDPAGIVRISSSLLLGREARPIAAGQVRIDIQVFAPRAAAVEARAWNGRLGVSGVEAGATLAAHDGDIVVDHVSGPVTTASTRGRQRLTGVAGVVSADDTFGDLAFDAISGDRLAARVHRGTVTATRIRSRTVAITTTFGDIEFRGELLAGGRVELRSFQGNVTAHALGAFTVDAQSRDGRLAPEVELRDAQRPEVGRLVGSYGDGAEPAALVLSSAAGRVVFGLARE